MADLEMTLEEYQQKLANGEFEEVERIDGESLDLNTLPIAGKNADGVPFVKNPLGEEIPVYREVEGKSKQALVGLVKMKDPATGKDVYATQYGVNTPDLSPELIAAGEKRRDSPFWAEAEKEELGFLDTIAREAMQVGVSAGLVDPETYDSWFPSTKSKAPQLASVVKKGLIDRAIESGTEYATELSPAAAAARFLEANVPVDRDYRAVTYGETPEEQAKKRKAEVAKASRDKREMMAGRDVDDPAWQEDGSVAGNIARVGADLIGSMVGGVISDPTSVIAPGKNAAQRVLAQAAVGAGSDAAVQGAEIAQDVRDDYDPLQTAYTASAGAAMQGAGEAIAKQAPKALAWLKSKKVPEEEIVKLAADKEKLGSLEDNLNFLADRNLVERDGDGWFNSDNLNSPKEVFDLAKKVQDKELGIDPVSKLTKALKLAGKASDEQIELTSQFRREQAAKLVEAQKLGKGEDSLNLQLTALKGSAPQADFEAVRPQLTKKDVTELFEQVKTAPGLSPFNSLTAQVGLRKLLEGGVPTKGELELLGQIFPKDMIKTALSKRGKKEQWGDILGNAVNLPRSMMATLDLSAPLRQGIFTIGRKEFYTSLPTMFKEFAHAFKKNDAAPVKDKNWVSSGSAVLDEIRQRPSYDLMDRAGLALTDMDSTSLSKREEDFMSDWAGKIPVFGRFADASNAAYTGFLNKLRADMFDDIATKSKAVGIDFNKDPKALKDIAKYINSATGRGDLGFETLERAAPLLNSIFFSPRLIKSRVDTLNPLFYSNLSPVARKEAIKDAMKFAAIATSVLSIAALSGAEVETDTGSSNFGKIKVGDTRYDVLGGYGQYITLGSRLLYGETKTGRGDVETLKGSAISTTQDINPKTKGDVAATFARNKLAPVPAYLINFLQGENTVGDKFDAKDDAIKMMIPLFIQSVAEAYEEEGMVGAVKAAPGIFGIGVSTYETPLDRFGRVATSKSETDKDVIELQRLGEVAGGMDGLIGYADKGDLTKFDASDEELKQYEEETGKQILETAKALMKSPEWAELEDFDKIATIKAMLPDIRKEVRARLFSQYGYSYEADEVQEEEEVSSEGVEGEAETIEADTFAAGVVQSVFPDAVVTSSHRGVDHELSIANPESDHLGFDAVDVRPIPGVTFEEFIQTLEDQGFTVLKKRNETGAGKVPWATGDHWHVVIDTSQLGVE